MSGADALDWTLAEAAQAVRQRRISSVELTGLALARAHALQPVLNACIAIEDEAALAAARAADAALARGAPAGVLHGVPLAHKDMFYRAGAVTTCGSRLRRDFIATTTATVLQRLDAAGALGIARLNMSEFALGPTGHNAHFGRVRNPWDTARISGGSSSGSGAAVAARMAFGALGSDTGGSVRLPASFCGVVGLKPTQGRVSRAGAMPLSFSQDCIGPLARSVQDVALLYAAIAGPDPADPTCSALPVQPPDLADIGSLRGIRIGVPVGFYDAAVDPQVAASMEAARLVLAQLGAELVEVAPPQQDDIGDLANIVTMSEAAAQHLDWLRTRADEYGPQVRMRLMQGLAIPAPLYLRALQRRVVLLQAMLDDVFSRCDVLHIPTVPMRVPTDAATDIGADAAAPDLIGAIARFTRTISFLGLPALAQPVGFCRDRCPIGAQIVAPPFAEAMALRVGAAYEAATDWTRRRPPLAA